MPQPLFGRNKAQPPLELPPVREPGHFRQPHLDRQQTGGRRPDRLVLLGLPAVFLPEGEPQQQAALQSLELCLQLMFDPQRGAAGGDGRLAERRVPRLDVEVEAAGRESPEPAGTACGRRCLDPWHQRLPLLEAERHRLAEVRVGGRYVERQGHHDPAMRGKTSRQLAGSPHAGIVHRGKPVAEPEQEAGRIGATGRGRGQQAFDRPAHHIDMRRQAGRPVLRLEKGIPAQTLGGDLLQCRRHGPRSSGRRQPHVCTARQAVVHDDLHRAQRGQRPRLPRQGSDAEADCLELREQRIDVDEHRPRVRLQVERRHARDAAPLAARLHHEVARFELFRRHVAEPRQLDDDRRLRDLDLVREDPVGRRRRLLCRQGRRGRRRGQHEGCSPSREKSYSLRGNRPAATAGSCPFRPLDSVRFTR